MINIKFEAASPRLDFPTQRSLSIKRLTKPGSFWRISISVWLNISHSIFNAMLMIISNVHIDFKVCLVRP